MKLDDSFPSAQFSLSNYEIRARRDRYKNGGGLTKFVKEGVISKRLKNSEPRKREYICSVITVSKKKWFCFSSYRPPSYDNLELFFDELASHLRKASESYENIVMMGDFNVNVANEGIEFDKLDEFYDYLI